MNRRQVLVGVLGLAGGAAGCFGPAEEASPADGSGTPTSAEPESPTATLTETTPMETTTPTETTGCAEGGYVELRQADVPGDAEAVEFGETSIGEIDEVVDAFESALEDGFGSTRVESTARLDEIDDQLPETAQYDGGGGPGGYYVERDGESYEISLIHYVGCAVRHTL